MTLGSSGGGATFDTAGFNLGLFGSLSGSGSLTKVDSGSLILAGVNSFSNGTTLAGGTLKITNNLAIGPGTIVLAGGTLSLGTLARRPRPKHRHRHPFPGQWQCHHRFGGRGRHEQLEQPGGLELHEHGAYRQQRRQYHGQSDRQRRLLTWASGSSNLLLNGYIYSFTTPLSATLSNIPYTNYSPYAYMADSTIGNNEKFTVGGKNVLFRHDQQRKLYPGHKHRCGKFSDWQLRGGDRVERQHANRDGPGCQPALRQSYRFRNCQYGGDSVVSGGLTLKGNPLMLSADSTIDVTGPPSGTITGLFTIGGNRLSLTGGGSGANTAYGLTLGSSGGVALTGNPTFDVANNGSGVGR